MPKSFQTKSSYKINMKNILSDLIDYRLHWENNLLYINSCLIFHPISITYF